MDNTGQGKIYFLYMRPIWLMGIALTLTTPLVTNVRAVPETKRVKSVKVLTTILSQVERESGIGARFTTLKLQIHLEDVYISQGTEIVLRPKDLVTAISALLKDDKPAKIVGRIILRRYQDGEFHEK